MLIYATLPTAAVVGHARIERVDRLAVEDIWLHHGTGASVSSLDFCRYFAGAENGCAVVLTEPTRFAAPVPLDRMRAAYSLRPPQSYMFLGDDHRDLIEHEQN
jgi:predicted transcriptional regulator